MRVSANITIDGVTTLVTTRPVDLLSWELGNKRKITDGMGYGDMMQIIHSAAKRDGLTDKAFTDWAATLEDFEPVVPDVDPTLQDQSTG